MKTVKISELKKQVLELNNLIEDYELNFLNLYNEINKISDYWQDAHEKSFYDDIALKKVEIKTTIEELKEINDIYTYIQNKYEILGKRVEFNLEHRNKVINNCNNYTFLLENIIFDYEKLDLSFCPNEARYLRNELSNLKKQKNKLIEYKNNINKTFEYIENLEKNIEFKISKIKIEILNDFDINKYI